MHFLVGDREDRAQHNVIAAGSEADDLPSAGEVFGKLADRQVLDQHAEQPLVQAVRQIEFLATPDRSKPSFRDQE